MADPNSPVAQRGVEMMRKVYAHDPTGREGPYFEITRDHLFGEIWARPGLSFRDRRLLLIGLSVGMGEHETTRVQVESALRNGDLEASELREIVIFLAHYAGWPRGSKLNATVEEAVESARS